MEPRPGVLELGQSSLCNPGKHCWSERLLRSKLLTGNCLEKDKFHLGCVSVTPLGTPTSKVPNLTLDPSAPQHHLGKTSSGTCTDSKPLPGAAGTSWNNTAVFVDNPLKSAPTLERPPAITLICSPHCLLLRSLPPVPGNLAF